MNSEQNAVKVRNSKRPDYKPSDPLLNSIESAAERGQGVSTFWRDVKIGRAPAPYYIGPKSPRWRQSEIRASIEATKKIPINPNKNSID